MSDGIYRQRDLAVKGWIICDKTAKTVTVRREPSERDPGTRFAGKTYKFAWDGFGFARSGRYLMVDGSLDTHVEAVQAEIRAIADLLTRNGLSAESAKELRASGLKLADVAAQIATNSGEMRRREREEMVSMLRHRGYDPAVVEALQVDGIGPEELRERLRVEGGAVGSLEWTHRARKV